MENTIISKFDQITIDTAHPLAFESADHLHPKGTRFDLSTNSRFIYKSKMLFAKACPQIRVLDLGCSGGSFVNEWVQTGHLAVGVEGSDYSRNFQRGAWPIISKFLFTADITKDFQLSITEQSQTQNLDFHIITAWEVMEHLDQAGLVELIANIKKHLSEEGIFVCSISPRESDTEGHELHQTVQSEDWWEDFLQQNGLFRNKDIESFYNHQYVRGGVIDDFDSFNFVLQATPKQSHSIPQCKWTHRLMDRWFNSKMQRSLKTLIGN